MTTFCEAYCPLCFTKNNETYKGVYNFSFLHNYIKLPPL